MVLIIDKETRSMKLFSKAKDFRNGFVDTEFERLKEYLKVREDG